MAHPDPQDKYFEIDRPTHVTIQGEQVNEYFQCGFLRVSLLASKSEIGYRKTPDGRYHAAYARKMDISRPG